MAAKDVPGCDAQLIAVKVAEVGQAAGSYDDCVGIVSKHIIAAGVGVVANRNAQVLEFGAAPVDDRDQVMPPACSSGKQQLST